MKTLFLLAAVVISHPSPALSRQGDRENVRREKIEAVLRLQDLRTPFDARMAALISDDDPVVRARAVLACGSLQDTSVIGLLTRALEDPDPATEVAAAFALGQTGTRLSERGRQTLEYDLIWKRLQGTQAAGRLIEEIGKFGTATALNDLMVFVANAPPVRHPESLMMSVARFAIRGITSPDAVRFLLRYVQEGVRTPWEAVYALQRIGDDPEIRGAIEQVRLLERQSDPLVRMNLATLIGKLHDAGGPADLLQRMADRDADWRVRVNAFKALGQSSWTGNAGVISTFRRAFFDANPHVAVTALSVFPSIGVTERDTSGEAIETLRQIASIAENSSGGYSWQLQAEAAAALAKIDGRIPRALLAVPGTVRTRLRARLLLAAGESGDPSAEALLGSAVEGTDPLIAAAGLEGLRTLALKKPGDAHLRDSVWGAAVRSVRVHDMAIVSTAASVLEDSLFRRSASVEPLIAALRNLRPPGDTETMQDVIHALGEMRDGRAVAPLTDCLRSMDHAVAVAAAEALKRITGSDYSGKITRNPEPVTADMDLSFLRALPPVVNVRLETSRGDIRIELNREIAPFTTMSIVKLSRQRGFFRGLTFHRVVPNFVIQGGDPRGDGWGGPGYSLRSEFSTERFGTGTVGIASAGKDTEGSQFFITHSPQPHLDGRYTIVGRVVEGMDVVDQIQVDDRIFDVRILN